MSPPLSRPSTSVDSRQAPWPARVLASCFGLGYLPLAPGTAGSVAALAAASALAAFAGWHGPFFAILAASIAIPGIWAADRVQRAAGDRDPSLVIVDEVIGQWVTLAGASPLNWKSGVAALLLFRFFDIVKPAPVRQAERLPGGVGIVADDVAAGLYAALVLWLAGCFNLY